MNYLLRVLTIFLCLNLVRYSLSRNHSSGLCEDSDVSCRSQLVSASAAEADCLVKYFPSHTEDCEEWVFSGAPDRQLGTVQLETYVRTRATYVWAAFNVSFLRIKWNTLRMRFKLSKRNDSQQHKNLCRQFDLRGEVPEGQRLYYDCPWAVAEEEDYEDQYYGFEYEASDAGGLREHRQFLLEVPRYVTRPEFVKLAEWPLFVYVDVTEAPRLVVHWTAPPPELGAARLVSGYELALHFNASSGGPEEVLPLGQVAAGQPLQLQRDVGSAPGAYRFGVRAIHPACGRAGCRLSFSPTIKIKGNSRLFLIAVVGCSVLIPMVLCALHVLKKWLDRPTTDVKPPPIVLMVYVPTHKAHVRVVKELAVYLRTFCEVEALLHDIDIPNDDAKESFTWYNKAYNRADFVMVVSSPLQHTTLRDTIYSNVENIAFNFLKEKFASPDVPSWKFFNAVLPYCDERDIPPEAVAFRRFFLLGELDDMLRYLRRGSSGLRAKVLPLPRPEVPGGPAHYKVYGGRLAAAIAEATAGVSTVGCSPGEHTDSTLCPQSSASEVCDEAQTSRDRLLQAEPRAPVHSPFFPDNVREVARVEEGRTPPKRPAHSRFDSMKL
ncbi:uncharacterized protein LOC134542824 [Bacillus rossius redtenbacheri]|uniref:uncharacterized protein LOC134542824 n=1 Tax=Bacillus rossius redtenbacheri TaxID=93214 RepID=UPI002FDEA9E1